MNAARLAIWGTALLLLLLALNLAGCSGSSGSGAAQSSGGEGGGAGGSGYAAGGGGGAEVAEEQAAGAGASAGAAASSASDDGMPSSASGEVASDTEFVEDEERSSEDQTGAGGFDRRVVKTAELGLRVKDVRESAAEAQRLAARSGGSILESRIYDDGGGTYADLVLSVPSERFEGTLDELRDLGREVTTDAISGEDVTEEFVDLESRERNLLAAEESLLRLYDRAERVEDTLDVGAELTEVRGQIEEVQGRMQYLENRTAFSSISLHVEPTQPVAVAATRPDWDPSTVAGGAWAASLNVLQAIATAVISAVVFGWWLVPLLALGLVLWRRRRSRSASRPAPTATGS